MTSLDQDAALAAEIAETAGQLLLKTRAECGLSGKALGDAGDAVAQKLILEKLRQARPDDAVLSEEGGSDADRVTRRRVWIIDPLDGTREYSEGRTDWAVHVALAIDGAPVVGAVAVPGRGLVLRSDRPGALPPLPERPRVLVSRTRPPRVAQQVAQHLGADLVEMGSAGAKAMAVILGEGDIYLHAGGQYQWDNCAPAAVALAYGLNATRLDGSPLVYNREETLVPDLLICRREYVAAVLEAL